MAISYQMVKSPSNNIFIDVNSVEVKLKSIIIHKINLGNSKSFVLKLCLDEINNFAKKLRRKLIKDEDIESLVRDVKQYAITTIEKYYKKVLILTPALIASAYTLCKEDKKNFKSLNSIVDARNMLYKLEFSSIKNQDSLKRAYPPIESYISKVKEAMNEIISDDITEAPIINRRTKKSYYGRKIFAKAERIVRGANINQKLNDLIAQGVTLVYVPAHANCSKRCEPFQGKYYTLDHTTKTLDGHIFVPIENATDIYVTTKSGRVWKNGLFGFNCRHEPIPYTKAFVEPNKIPAKVISRQRNIEKKQREMERKIYNFLRLSFVYEQSPIKADKVIANQYKQLANGLINHYRSFCHSNKVPYYPDRFNIYL